MSSSLLSSCNYTPASESHSIGVAATDIYDRRYSSSNYGNCVDIYAPGKDILSTYIGSNTATNFLTGSSMASPFVAGVVAIKLSKFKNANLKSSEMKTIIKETGMKDKVKGNIENTTNLFLYNNV